MFVINGSHLLLKSLVVIKGALEVISCLMRVLKPKIVIRSMYWLPLKKIACTKKIISFALAIFFFCTFKSQHFEFFSLDLVHRPHIHTTLSDPG